MHGPLNVKLDEVLYIDNDMRFTTRSNNSSAVQYAVHVFRLTK